MGINPGMPEADMARGTPHASWHAIHGFGIAVADGRGGCVWCMKMCGAGPPEVGAGRMVE